MGDAMAGLVKQVRACGARWRARQLRRLDLDIAAARWGIELSDIHGVIQYAGANRRRVVIVTATEALKLSIVLLRCTGGTRRGTLSARRVRIQAIATHKILSQGIAIEMRSIAVVAVKTIGGIRSLADRCAKNQSQNTQ